VLCRVCFQRQKTPAQQTQESGAQQGQDSEPSPS
jgi:hypothetical protein